ncbi:MAG: glyceraldehyde 3-phosphate dehydrogenase NAD-binding domain-containing protein [Pseudomonadota bacterium]
MKLGINALGRIGKLTLWHHVGRKYFSEIVVNTGRQIGRGLEDLAASIERDSSYGRLGNYLHGYKGGRMVENLNEVEGTMTINGVPVRILRESRNPKDIQWKENGVRLVVDTTGVFNDPTADADSPKGAFRGHLAAGAEKAILSAPFKIKEKGLNMPDDAVTTVMGINDDDYIPGTHNLISAASCTTTCLSYMIKPLIDQIGAANFLSASMVTVHAATSSQKVLDSLPKTGASDLRKNRSIMNNIILTTTGAAKALALVIPEMKDIGFIAESVRIPTSTGSLIVLVVNLQDDLENPIKRDRINGIYREFAATSPYLVYSEEQNVSSDIIGTPFAAATIEGTETHTRTANIRVNLDKIKGCAASDPVINVPVTQAVIYGWYDNELGSYTNMLADRTVSIAEQMV